MGVELKHLRYFVAVAEQLNFSATARNLFISQQALSRIIQQLERDVGVRLLERTTRSVTLTPAGEALLESARASIAMVDDAVAHTRRLGGQPRPLRIDVSSAGLETGARIFSTLRREHPRQPIHQVEDGAPRGMAALLAGKLDVLIALDTHRPASVPSEPIRREPVLLGMAADHPLAQADAVAVAQLAGVELLLPSEEAAVEWLEFVDRFCRAAGVTPKRWPGVTHGSVAAATVLREYGCVTPTVAWAEPPPDLVFRPLVDPTPVMRWSMMTAPSLPGEFGTVLDSLRTVARRNQWLAVCAAEAG
ncbi:LysR family transcriptional regulator [Nocardia sp. BMG51109]|uniref:LysR family transcriptional regulator n=1 Tax=Nocardia sp. BMG51109 TaxID=1056816 RepID=UPI00046774D5|nr:LysR family transcriptional regulator [Nocardia sp. BMG51109]